MEAKSCCMCNVLLNKKNTATNDNISGHKYLEFCSSCVNDEGWDLCVEKWDTIVPKELMTIISYYLYNPLDIINAAKSNVFPSMGENNYWVDRLHFEFPHIPRYVIMEPFIQFDYFYRSMNYYYAVINGYKDLFHNYGADFQRNDTYCKSDNKIKVLYHYYGKDHDGYCSDCEEEDVDEYEEYTYNLPEGKFSIPREIINKSKHHYMGCGETFYKILSVTYLKDTSDIKNEDMCKMSNSDREEIIKIFGKSQEILKDNYDIIIYCRFCNQNCISKSNIIKCKYCH